MFDKQSCHGFSLSWQYFQVEYTKDKLLEYIQEDDDTLPLKNADDTVSCGAQFMLGTDKRATITTNWLWFCHHANIREGDICAFHFKRRGPAPPFSHRPPSLDAMPSAPSIAYGYYPSSIFSLSLRLDVRALWWSDELCLSFGHWPLLEHRRLRFQSMAVLWRSLFKTMIYLLI